MLNIIAFNQINYYYLKHICQFLKDQADKKFKESINYLYLQRVRLKTNPAIGWKNHFNYLLKNKKSLNYIDKGIKIFNLPPFNVKPIDNFLTSLTYNKVKKLAESFDVILTFEPSPHIKKCWDSAKVKIYYNVEDLGSMGGMRKVSKNILNFENYIVNTADIMFCDTLSVLKRYHKNPTSILDINLSDNKQISEIKFIYVPSPAPDEFYLDKFNLESEKYKYDFVFFGSFNNCTDVLLLKEIANKGYKLLIVTDFISDSYLSNHKNVTVKEATSNFNRLAKYIMASKFIIFPYIDNKYTSVFSPAKIYQSLATGKLIFTRCKSLLSRFSELRYLNFDEIKGIKNKVGIVSENLYKYRVSNIIPRILRLIVNLYMLKHKR